MLSRFSRLTPAEAFLAVLVSSVYTALPARADALPPPSSPRAVEAVPKSGDPLAEAIGAVKDSDLPKAVAKLELLLKRDPQNRQALVLLAKIRQEQGFEQAQPESAPYYLKAAELARRVLALPTEPGKHEMRLFAAIFYCEACSHAVARKPEKAVAALTEAVKLGFVDLDAVDLDDDLSSIRQRPEFTRLRKQMETAAVPIAKERAAELLASNKPFPFTFELSDLNGKEVSLADYKGKVTIVDIWGTWCPPCRMEIPHFVKLYERFHKQGLEIVGLNYEREDDDARARKLIRAFVKENGVPYRCVLGDEKTQAQIQDFQGFPTTLFVDRAGVVRLKAVGYHSLIDLEAIVSQLLNETSEKPR